MRDYLEVCEAAVRRAGAVLLDHFGHVTARHKGPADLVTEADVAAQEAVRQTLRDAFPGHLLIGEEDPPDRGRRAGAEFCWIVDPLDGTTNYVHRVPFFCVSLALEHQGELLVASVYDPKSDVCFSAESTSRFSPGAVTGLHHQEIPRRSVPEIARKRPEPAVPGNRLNLESCAPVGAPHSGVYPTAAARHLRSH